MSGRMNFIRVAATLLALAPAPGCDLLDPPECAGICTRSTPEQITLPRSGARDVPLNANIWLTLGSGPGTPTDVVVTTGDTTVSGTIRRLESVSGGPDLQQFVPKALLEPQTTYVVAVGGVEVSRFMTGTTSLDEERSLPRTTVIQRHMPEDTCDAPSGMVALDPPGALNLVVRAGSEAFFDEGSSKRVVMIISTSTNIALNGGGCGNWDGTSKVRFGTLDITGRFSGWGETL